MLSPAVLVRLNEIANRTFSLPRAVFSPTSRCNSRCVSCQWWQASGEGDLAVSDVGPIADGLAALGTRTVVFSGGEPLLRPEVFEMASLFTRRGMAVELHTSGVLLERCAAQVVTHVRQVVVSFDAADEDSYRNVRGVAAFGTVAAGVRRLREMAPAFPISALATLHRLNFRELPQLIACARALGFDRISFRAADVAPGTFGRDAGRPGPPIGLTRDEVVECADLVERTVADAAEAFSSGFVVQSPAMLRRVPQYYAALLALAPFPPVQCDVPYASIVIEADGTVRPCPFHAPVGSTRETPLQEIVRRNLRAFRAALSVEEHPTCERCTCPSRTGWRWAASP